MENNSIFGYTFKNPQLLKCALTHTSYANEKHLTSNQRLEFLGDSVVGLIVSEYIYKKFPEMQEGELSRIKAGIVCSKGLMKCAKKINLGSLLFLGKGEEQNGGRARNSNLEDAFEAVIGAVYLDSDFATAKQFTLSVMQDVIEEMVEKDGIEDYKTALQEYCQSGSRHCDIEYHVKSESGPDHAKVYEMEVLINGRKEGSGTGKSKKEAEQNAAKSALAAIKK